jgi:hypothetical protein
MLNFNVSGDTTTTGNNCRNRIATNEAAHKKRTKVFH